MTVAGLLHLSCTTKAYPTALCSTHEVPIDAGADAFAGVATFLTGADCSPFCDTSIYSMCRLVTEKSVEYESICPKVNIAGSIGAIGRSPRPNEKERVTERHHVFGVGGAPSVGVEA